MNSCLRALDCRPHFWHSGLDKAVRSALEDTPARVVHDSRAVVEPPYGERAWQ